MKQKLLLSGLAVSTVGITSYLLKRPVKSPKSKRIHSQHEDENNKTARHGNVPSR